MIRGDKYLQEGGESEIDWLTDSDKKLLDYFDYVHSFSGIRRNERARFWVGFWTIVQVGWVSLYFYSVPYFIEKLDLFAHLVHHTVMGFDDLLYIYILSTKKQYLDDIRSGLTKTYNYNSTMVRNYHRKLMSERLKFQYPIIAKLITGSAVSLFIYLEVFFLLEATFLKNYETMYPVAFPFEIHHWGVYLSVVFMQKVTIYVTMLMVQGTTAIIYVCWCHLVLEYEVLIYAVSHVEEIVAEKLQEADCKSEAETKETLARVYNYYCYHFAKHHLCIRQYFSDVKNCNGVTIFLIFFTGLICFACVGITLLSDNLGVKLKFVFILVLQAIIIYGWCWIGEDITSKEEQLSRLLPSVPWWLMPKQCHTTILLMLMGSQNPPVLSTPFNQVASRQGFKDMISSSYSCFSLMYQMKFSK